jgi:N-formylglutamate amidohydrolase
LDVSANPNRLTEVIRIDRPDEAPSCPLLFASPHSGRAYEPALSDTTCLSLDILRRSEDAYVDLLVRSAPDAGALLLGALFPRVFVDVNRGPWELDPGMFSDRLPAEAGEISRRAASGLGVVPRIGAEGRPLYRRRLRYEEAKARLDHYYRPYHAAMEALIGELTGQFGHAIVLDMHSMPEQSARGVDFVIGDRFGTSCHRAVAETVEAALRELGFVTVRNIPYAGGYTTEHYGRPESGVHVVQIEINRALYLDETRVARSALFDPFEAKMRKFVKLLARTDWDTHLQP